MSVIEPPTRLVFFDHLGTSRFVSTTVIRRCDRERIRLPDPAPVEASGRPYVLLGAMFRQVVVCTDSLPEKRMLFSTDD